MLVLLVGPKGSGKSHIGRILERRLGVRFFHVEPLWKDYYADCRAAGREPSIPEGIRTVHPHIRAALAAHEHVCVETTGASAEILGDLSALAPETQRLLVRVSAPLNLCLDRIASRDPTHQIPMDVPGITKVHALSTAAPIEGALALENIALSETEIVSFFASALAGRSTDRG